jgi:hypothetical protein
MPALELERGSFLKGVSVLGYVENGSGGGSRCVVATPAAATLRVFASIL